MANGIEWRQDRSRCASCSTTASRSDNRRIEDTARITVESQFIVDHAAEQLSGTFQHGWVSANHHDADVLGHAIVRATLSFLALAPASVEDAATALAHLLTPYIEAIRTPS
ncbi:MAG TPA: hypothetical protein VIJ23_10425 [Mycobacterium sp.]